MNKLIKLIVIALLSINSLSAEVRFDLRFTDPDGEGFNDPKNEWMKKAVSESADLFGKWIKQNAFVTVEVNSLKEGLGIARSIPIMRKISSSKGTVISKAMEKILGEDEKFSGLFEGKIEFILEKFSDYKRLKQVTLHELTHTLGFNSFFNLNRTSVCTPYDQLIFDSNENAYVKDTGWIWNNFKRNPNFRSDLDLFACGLNIKKRNNERCVKVENFKISPESAISHLDFSTYPKNMMNPHGLSHIWNKYEIGIMEDLGYKIDWENYCKNVRKERTLNVDMDSFKGLNSYLLVKKLRNKDFPDECYDEKNEIFYESFSTPIFGDCELELFVDGQSETSMAINRSDNIESVCITNKADQIKNVNASHCTNLYFFEIKEKECK